MRKHEIKWVFKSIFSDYLQFLYSGTRPSIFMECLTRNKDRKHLGFHGPLDMGEDGFVVNPGEILHVKPK